MHHYFIAPLQGAYSPNHVTCGVALVVLHICRLLRAWWQVGAGGPTALSGFRVYEIVHSYAFHAFCARLMSSLPAWSRRAAGTYLRANSTISENV